MRLLVSFVALSIFAGLLVRWMIYPASFHYFFKKLTRITFWLALLLLMMGWLATPAATANVEFLKEADQWIYQSQTVLSDQQSNVWEVTALKQMDGENRGFYLRLVTESPGVQLDAVQPLMVQPEVGARIPVPNVTRQQFMGDLPNPQVGQYDLQGMLYKIGESSSLQLQLPTRTGEAITLSIPAEILDEWFSVGSCDYLICAPQF